MLFFIQTEKWLLLQKCFHNEQKIYEFIHYAKQNVDVKLMQFRYLSKTNNPMYDWENTVRKKEETSGIECSSINKINFIAIKMEACCWHLKWEWFCKG